MAELPGGGEEVTSSLFVAREGSACIATNAEHQIDDQAAVCGKCGTALQNDSFAGSRGCALWSHSSPIRRLLEEAGGISDRHDHPADVGMASLSSFLSRFSSPLVSSQLARRRQVALYRVVFMVLFITVGVAASVLYVLYWPWMESSPTPGERWARRHSALWSPTSTGERDFLRQGAWPEPGQVRLGHHLLRGLHHDRLHAEEAGPA